jgi:hypothetical protein
METTVARFLMVIVAAAALAAPARAADQTIKANLSLSGFKTGAISVAFETGDLFDFSHSCDAGTGSSCTAQNSYGSPPKNVGNVLCMPNNLAYTISSACQQILAQGATSGCKSNILKSACPSSSVAIAPACNWVSSDSTNTVVNWNWNLSAQGGGCVITVNCSTSNYQGQERD